MTSLVVTSRKPVSAPLELLNLNTVVDAADVVSMPSNTRQALSLSPIRHTSPTARSTTMIPNILKYGSRIIFTLYIYNILQYFINNLLYTFYYKYYLCIYVKYNKIDNNI